MDRPRRPCRRARAPSTQATPAPRLGHRRFGGDRAGGRPRGTARARTREDRARAFRAADRERHAPARDPAGDQPLLPGARIHKGDRLAMAIQGSDSMYVYVLDQDEVGNVFVLFPLPGLNLANPLPIRAPPPSRSRPGQHVLMGGHDRGKGDRPARSPPASRSRAFEQEIELVPRARPGQAIPLDRLAVLRLRGIGGVEATRTEGVQGSASTSGAFDLAGALERTMQSSRVWFWSTTLENPPRRIDDPEISARAGGSDWRYGAHSYGRA